MVRKSLLLMLGLLCFVGVMPAFAQDEAEAEAVVAYEACTEEELAATLEGIAEYNAALAELGDIGAGPADNDYGAILAAYDSYSYEFWYTFYPELPPCAEAVSLGLTIGMIYDDYLTIGLLKNLAAWAEASGDADSAAGFGGSADLRTETVQAGLALSADITAEDLSAWVNDSGLEACDEETLAAALTTITEYYQTITDTQAQMSEEMAQDVSALIVSDVAAQTFWADIYPTVNSCYEANYYAWETGRILDEFTIIAALTLNANVEAEAGNTEVSDTLLASAEARKEGLVDYMAAVYGTEEETEE